MPNFHVTIHDMESAVPRPYRMTARARATEETGERILDAVAEVFWERPSDQISLDEVAARAGVTVRTLIRRFGGKQGMLEAGAAREAERERGVREQAPVGDVPAAVAVLVENYEATGDRVLKMLAEEQRRTGAERRRRLAQIVAICDVYTWKLLRRDSGLSRRQTELALVELLTPLLEAP